MKLRYLFYRRDLSLEEPYSSQLKTENQPKKSNTTGLNKTIQYLLIKRRESIINSTTRPLYQEALKSLFLVIVLLVDTLIPMEIYLNLPNIINILLTLVTLGIFLYVEIRIYNLLWGKKGCWSLEKYKKKSEKNKEDTN
jgi:hypothetical protein